MKRGFAALVLIVAGVAVLVVSALISPLFFLGDVEANGVIALSLMIGGVVLLVAGLVVWLTAPKAKPDTQYDHDLPQN